MIEPKLPWEFELLAFYRFENDLAYIVTIRRDAHHPFVLHTCNVNSGFCFWGHYFETYREAVACFQERINNSTKFARFLDEQPDNIENIS
jgi:hypothetical protein